MLGLRGVVHVVGRPDVLHGCVLAALLRPEECVLQHPSRAVGQGTATSFAVGEGCCSFCQAPQAATAGGFLASCVRGAQDLLENCVEGARSQLAEIPRFLSQRALVPNPLVAKPISPDSLRKCRKFVQCGGQEKHRPVDLLIEVFGSLLQNAVSCAALTATGAVAGATLSSTGAVSGSSLSITGAASVGLLSSATGITGSTLTINNTNLHSGRRVHGHADGLRRSDGGELRSHRGGHGRHADGQRGGLRVREPGLHLHGHERRSVDGQRGLRLACN